MRKLETIYRVKPARWLPSDNTPMMYFEVVSGHDSRDYAAENYRGLAPMTPPATFRTEREALGCIAYNRDCDLRPTYHDGSPRPHWSALRDWARDTWIRNPTIPEDAS